jgi:hypothetical protein
LQPDYSKRLIGGFCGGDDDDDEFIIPASLALFEV